MRRPITIITEIVLLSLLLLSAPFPAGAAAEVSPARWEAEDASLIGHASVSSAEGVSWVEGFQTEGDRMELACRVDKTGFYDVTVVLASMDGQQKENPVLLDGSFIGSVIIKGKDFGRSTLSHVYFTEGGHVLTIGVSWGWIRVDAVEIACSAALPGDLYKISPRLVNPSPSSEAQKLFSWLCECYGKKIITGQFCDGGMYGLENQAVWRSTGGKYPAILGLDMLDYTPSRVEHGGVGSSVEHALEYWEKGGIVAFCWHWNAPSPYLTEKWYSGFYADDTTFDLARVMSGKDEEGYRLLLRDIDAIAAQLTVLRDAGVPVLWRPLHEASGGWFWWGASGPEAYLRLWNLLYDRLTNVHGLNNLIWIWNGQNKDWYPGDDTVDIIGEDIYPGERMYGSQSSKFVECLDYTQARKMIILSENGCVPDPELLFRDGTVWGSYCTWGGEFVLKSSKFNKPSEKYTEVSMLQKMYSDERAVTRSDIPDFRSAGE